MTQTCPSVCTAAPAAPQGTSRPAPSQPASSVASHAVEPDKEVSSGRRQLAASLFGDAPSSNAHSRSAAARKPTKPVSARVTELSGLPGNSAQEINDILFDTADSTGFLHKSG